MTTMMPETTPTPTLTLTHTHTHTQTSPHPHTTITHLSNELLRDILDHIDADPERTVNIDRRAYLSVESFRPPDPPPPPRAQDIANFRLTCRRFADLGSPHQFTRIATRFSPKGLKRLEWIAGQPHLTRHTKKFSYLIPYFYVEGRTDVRNLLHHAGGELQSLDAAFFENKIEAQRGIVRSGQDLRILKQAMRAFTSLQHVQILRLQDQADSALLDYLHENEENTRFVDLRWTPACSHATRTMGAALLEARSPVTRFSGPMMNPQSGLDLRSRDLAAVTSIAERVTCLELHFDDASNLTEKMTGLSDMFGAVFRAARNMQAVHLGFPSRAPLDLSLEAIFHNVKWDKLRAFGVQAWRLDGDEILGLARRHRKTLRGLRLRDVQLRSGSMWKDVLEVLREEMEQLEWVSLRRIDYADHFDTMWSGSIEVPADWPPGLASDSEDSDEGDGFHAHVNLSDDSDEGDRDDGSSDSDDFPDDEDNDDDSDAASHADSDHGPDANELELPVSPDTPVSLPVCTCERSGYPTSANDLGDNGRCVVYQQRKLWEKWVVKRCPEHSSP